MALLNETAFGRRRRGPSGRLLAFDPQMQLDVLQIPPRAPAGGLLFNPDIDDATRWRNTGGWGVVNGRAVSNGSAGTFFYQMNYDFAQPFVVGQRYRMLIYIPELLSGGIRCVTNNYMIDQSYIRAGYFRLDFTATAGDTSFSLQSFSQQGQNLYAAVEWVDFYPI